MINSFTVSVSESLSFIMYHDAVTRRTTSRTVISNKCASDLKFKLCLASFTFMPVLVDIFMPAFSNYSLSACARPSLGFGRKPSIGPPLARLFCLSQP
jgi:hypothetical protein